MARALIVIVLSLLGMVEFLLKILIVIALAISLIGMIPLLVMVADDQFKEIFEPRLWRIMKSKLSK